MASNEFSKSCEKAGLLVGKESLASIAASPEFPALVASYAAESMMPELAPFNPDLAAYAQLESLGLYVCASARLDGRLVGFIGIGTSPALHYSRRLPVIESIFVDRSVRGAAGAGRGLLSFARAHARAMGAKLLLMSAPPGGAAERFFAASGATHRSSTMGLAV